MRKNIGEYLVSLPSNRQSSIPSDADALEAQYLQRFSQMYQETRPATNVSPGKDIVLPQQNQLRARPIKQQAELIKDRVNKTSIEQTLQAVTVSVPENVPTPIEVPKQQNQQVQAQAPTPTPILVEQQPQSQVGPQSMQTASQTHAATTNQNLPFPELPKQANLLVGMVLSSEGKIISDAVIQILDKKDTPIRALKSNQLGQFFAASPLQKGNYKLVPQKEGFQFDTVTLKLKNKVVPPIEIRAQ
jgi:hypothetical protein